MKTKTDPRGRTMVEKCAAGREVWQPAFLSALAIRGVVTLAARDAGVGMNVLLRAREQNKRFAADWDLAIHAAMDRLEAEAIRRATEGVVKPVFRGGEQIGETIVYSDRLLEFLLKSKREKAKEKAAAKAKETGPATDAEGHVILTPELMEQLAKDVKRFLPSRS